MLEAVVACLDILMVLTLFYLLGYQIGWGRATLDQAREEAKKAHEELERLRRVG